MPLGGQGEAHDLPKCVDASVGPTRGMCHHAPAPAREALEHTLEFTLHGAVGVLALPTRKVVAGVLKDGVEWVPRHAWQR